MFLWIFMLVASSCLLFAYQFGGMAGLGYMLWSILIGALVYCVVVLYPSGREFVRREIKFYQATRKRLDIR